MSFWWSGSSQHRGRWNMTGRLRAAWTKKKKKKKYGLPYVWQMKLIWERRLLSVSFAFGDILQTAKMYLLSYVSWESGKFWTFKFYLFRWTGDIYGRKPKRILGHTYWKYLPPPLTLNGIMTCLKCLCHPSLPSPALPRLYLNRSSITGIILDENRGQFATACK